MAQTGFTPIQLYSSSTATNVPLAANLATGELAINITDGKLFYKDNAAAVQVIGWKVVPATAGGTGQTSYAVGDLLYADTTTTLAKLPDVATGNALISGGVGVAPSWGKIGLTTHISGVLPVANGGTNASTASITSFNNITGYSASGATGTTTTNLVFSTGPSITTPKIITSINDTNNNVLLGITATASAVNQLTVANAIASSSPVLSATGTDTNIDITATPKGTGAFVVTSTTDSSSTTTGSLRTAGGLGVAKIATVNVLREITGEAWTAYTPTLAVDTGTITTSIINARYRQLGKTIFISLSISFTVTSGSPTEFRVSFPSSQVAPNNNQYTPVYMTFNSTAILGLARATVNSYGLQITPSNGLTYVGNCGFFVNTVFELN